MSSLAIQTASDTDGMPARSSFKSDVIQSLFALRSALAEAFTVLPGPLRRAADLQRRLGVSSNLAWQLHGVMNLQDPLAAAGQVPGRRAVRRVLEAVQEKGAPGPAVERLKAAFEEFEGCVERHAGGRPAFDSMVSSISDAPATAVDIEARREMFRAASHLYGVQVTVAAACYIVHPSAAPGRLDMVGVTGLVGLRAMRPFDRLYLGRQGYSSDHMEAEPPSVRPVDDLGGDLAGLPLLRDFCSKPLPRITTVNISPTALEAYLCEQLVGREAAVTYCSGEHWPSVAAFGEHVTSAMTILYPSEVQIHDVLLARSVVERIQEPLTGVYGGADREQRRKCHPSDRLPVGAQAVFSGVGVEALATPEMPRYVDMLRHVCARVGWDPDVFDAYRCRVEFPVLHSLTAVRFPGSNDDTSRP